MKLMNLWIISLKLIIVDLSIIYLTVKYYTSGISLFLKCIFVDEIVSSNLLL